MTERRLCVQLRIQLRHAQLKTRDRDVVLRGSRLQS
ncbi:Uncharacterised protein [Vibrio cholerae]|nr:Uncharacterised protein [Vibrio cholerae]CSI55637.1 Uncharacterised protein [Vibrio cholerae]